VTDPFKNLRAAARRRGRSWPRQKPIRNIPSLDRYTGKPLLESAVKPSPYPEAAKEMARRAGIRLEEQDNVAS
jgi:hypothetical protein